MTVSLLRQRAGCVLLGIVALWPERVGAQALRFVPVTPCRVIDTRVSEGLAPPFGPPALSGGVARAFPLIAGRCPVSPTASAFSLNVTVVPYGPLGYLTVWPLGEPQPFVSTLNSPNATVVANAVIVRGGESGAVSFYATSPTDLIVDITGYFDSTSDTHGYFPVAPCRAVDTRMAMGPFGGPSMPAGQIREFALGFGVCPVPFNAAAYSVNVTAVPAEPLAYLTVWQGGGVPKPFASTLNSFDGRVVANAALVGASAAGAIDIFTTHRTDVVVDVNGFFGNALPGVSPAFFPVRPCRAVDTRLTSGPLAGPIVGAGSTRSFPLTQSGCGLPPGATAYALNVTAVPEEPLSYLTVWPSAMPLPPVSTLNSNNGSVVANAALTGAGPDGAINVFATHRTHVVVDVSGYFAPAPVLAPLAVPVPLTPMEGTIFSHYPRTTTVTWSGVTGANRYGVEVQYCVGGVTQCFRLTTADVTGTSFTFPFAGAQPGRWRVWAWDDTAGRASHPSAWTTFRYTL